MTILICTPYRATTHPALIATWQQNAQKARRVLGDVETFLLPDNGGAHMPGDYSSNATARNRVLDAVDLNAYTHLLWCDIDLIRWDARFAAWALAENPHGITAPAVILDTPGNDYYGLAGPIFYDTLGYIEQGHRARLEPPWFEQEGPIVELDSVGCVYCVPSRLYQDGARYQQLDGRTEHEGVMRAARAQGIPIVANLEYQAIHAWLPEYGEGMH